MKNNVIIGLASLTIAFAIFAADTNKPVKLQSVGTNTPCILATDTNAVLALPYVQVALRQAWGEGAQFGVSAAINNRTLVQMQDAQGLYKAAMFMRFGGGVAK